MKVKRIIAYLIDMFIISLLANIIFSLAFPNNFEKYNEKADEYVERILSFGSADIAEDELMDMNYTLSKLQAPNLIIKLGLTILYFGILSFMWNGKTLGKKILKIRVVPIKGKKLNPPLYLLRGILITNSLFNLIDIINTSVFKGEMWNGFASMISYGKMIMSVMIIGVMIFRDDERGLHDLICRTKVIEEKPKEEI